jgi:hypothetical protein
VTIPTYFDIEYLRAVLEELVLPKPNLPNIIAAEEGLVLLAIIRDIYTLFNLGLYFCFAELVSKTLVPSLGIVFIFLDNSNALKSMIRTTNFLS